MKKLPVTVLSYDNIEADDTIGYLCRQVLTDSQITVMSTDKDFLQLANGRIKIWSPTKKKMYDDFQNKNRNALTEPNWQE